MEEDALVMLPSPLVGHLASLIEFAKLILTRRPSLSIHILLVPVPDYVGLPSFIPSSIPSIEFHHLPADFVPPDVTFIHKETLIFHLLRQTNPHIHQFLLEFSRRKTIRAFIIDFFCTCAYEVASEFNIPTYFYFTSPVGCFNYYAYLPTLHYSDTQFNKESNTEYISVPGISPLLPNDFPVSPKDINEEAYRYFFEFAETIPKSAGIVVNTFDALEAEAISAFRSGECLPNQLIPPLYCTGPLLSPSKCTSGRHECLNWLDSQPEKSVVFLSFGSIGLFTKEQIMEIAMGLERSGEKFLWVLRDPPSKEDVDTVLPEGFKERTKERGFLVKNWAPQMAVLEHVAIGGFVTHCGWNSVLEAVCMGVPMVAWPLYAEQRMNREQLVGRGIAISMDEDNNRFVRSEEVEKKVKEIMDDAVSEPIRLKCDAMRVSARKAIAPGGSSFSDLGDFCNHLNST